MVKIRETHRDKVFAAEMAEYEKRQSEFARTSSSLAQYRARVKFYEDAKALERLARKVDSYFGREIFSEDEAGSHRQNWEWSKIQKITALLRIRWSTRILRLFAYKAPFEFLSSEAQGVIR